ncbi:tRNA (N(6)-L-threonylcarbamoyladenosine(37)-C(2))-methylthiotransferase [Candidatus Woesearchaeota archaeon]|nr:tRNA (N(6)-L-threonylcarbamoyladenosine(37)-C(2))-methylthiotransferase [Candidatus Woesearchaeota archaeon]
MAKVRFITFGCSNNLAETEIMSGLLRKAGHQIVQEQEDIAVVNMCSVKGPSVQSALKAVKQAENKVVVAGCIAPFAIPEIRKIGPEVSLLSTHNIHQIADVVEFMEEGSTVELLSKDPQSKVALPKIRKNPVVSIIPVCSGCQFNCSYCATKLVKGSLYSYPREQIVEEVKTSLQEGCREIWLTSQDTGAYGHDKGESFPALLKEILAVQGFFKVRVGMTNPNHVYRDLKELLPLYKHEKMFKFLHMPVQSGNNRVLQAMKRPYRAEQYLKAVEQFKKEIPLLTVSTDIIVGFPTETEEEFHDTLQLIEKTKPEVVNLSKFWKMPGTAAAEMAQLPGAVIKSRSLCLTKMLKEIWAEKNKSWIGWQGPILIDEIGRKGFVIGRNEFYRPAVLEGDYRLGDIINVKITDASILALKAVEA